jgi:hypothetical protein
MCFVIDEMQFKPDVISIAIQVIIEKVYRIYLNKMISPNTWPNDVILTALDTLAVFSDFLKDMLRVKVTFPLKKIITKLVIVEVCKYLDQLLHQDSIVV